MAVTAVRDPGRPGRRRPGRRGDVLRLKVASRGCTVGPSRRSDLRGSFVTTTDTSTSAEGPLSASTAALRGFRSAIGGQLPSRYSNWWHKEYHDRLEPSLREGITVLDVGSGRSPTIPPDQRPPNTRYIGLDLSSAELDASPEGWYDDSIVADVVERIPHLEGTCDLAVSYFVLEHVADLPRAFDNLHAYLVPDGRLVVIFSGAFSVFGLANRVMPRAVSSFVLRTLLHRPTESVFPAYYDHCWASALDRCFSKWSSVEIVPLWFGAPYFTFSRALESIYVAYEEWARAAGHRNLAPYYLVSATR